MEYRDIAFSKAKEYGLEIVENAQPDDEDREVTKFLLERGIKNAWVEPDDPKTIYFAGQIENCCDLFAVLHEIGHIVLEHATGKVQASKYIAQEFEAYEFAFSPNHDFDVTLSEKDLSDISIGLGFNILRVESIAEEWSPLDMFDHMDDAFRAAKEIVRGLIEDNPRINVLEEKGG